MSKSTISRPIISSLVYENILKLYNNLNKKIDINILFVNIIGIKIWKNYKPQIKDITTKILKKY